MAIQWLSNNEQEQSEDLPWLKEYYATRVRAGDDRTYQLITAYDGEKGLLVQTTEFKAFLFRNSSDYRMVVEALTVWVSSKGFQRCLVVKPVSKSKIIFGLDDEIPRVFWHKEETRFYSVQEEDALVGHATNPLLAPLPITPHSSEELVAVQANGKNPQPEAATKTRKPLKE